MLRMLEVFLIGLYSRTETAFKATRRAILLTTVVAHTAIILISTVEWTVVLGKILVSSL